MGVFEAGGGVGEGEFAGAEGEGAGAWEAGWDVCAEPAVAVQFAERTAGVGGAGGRFLRYAECGYGAGGGCVGC